MMVTATAKAKPAQTRTHLLAAAAEEMRQNGFRAASLDHILTQAGVTKGALYHHFRNKLELGYAVLEEVFRVQLLENWAHALEDASDPIDGLIQQVRQLAETATAESLQHGCPLNNLAQEMAGVEEGFRVRIERVFGDWRGLIASALEKGKSDGTVRVNLDSDKSALFITAVIEGSVGAAKNARDPAVLKSCFEGLEHYLLALRPRVSFRGSGARSAGTS